MSSPEPDRKDWFCEVCGPYYPYSGKGWRDCTSIECPFKRQPADEEAGK